MRQTSILVTDDERNIRMMLRTTFESDGYLVREACNGREALEAIEQSTPDLMVLDLNMPVIDGMAVLEQMQSMMGNKPRVIVLTAHGSIPAAVKACRLGAMDFLEKPIMPAALRETVAEVLSEPAPMPAPAMGKIEELDQFERGYAGVLERVRKALRLANYEDAQALLTRIADLGGNDPAYFNVMGILYESQREFRLARKFFNKALAVRGQYEPALMNLRRLEELRSRGKTDIPIVFGESIEDGMWGGAAAMNH